MAKERTVHTPEPDQIAASGTLRLAGCKLADFRRVDPASASIHFHAALGRGFEKLFDKMGWQVPTDHTTRQGLEGRLKGGNLILTANAPDAGDDKIKAKSRDGKVNTQAEINLEYDTITGFQCLRLEIEGRKGKGYRRELRFEVKFSQEDGCALLESYMMQTDNARGVLVIKYTIEPEQTAIDEVKATEEQRQAVMDL
jgi:hypothetical protein